MLPDQPQGDSLLERGAAALRVGNRDRARELLGAAVRADPQNILAWLWLSGALDNPAQQRQCLERVLSIDPQNMAALRGLELLCLENEGQALGERSQDLAAVQLPSVVFPPPPASGPRLPPPIIIVLLSILGGPGLILSWAARQRLGDQVTPGMLLAMALVAGPPLVLLGVVLLAVLLRISGRILGGRGTTGMVQAGLAWAVAPQALGLLIWLVQLVLIPTASFGGGAATAGPVFIVMACQVAHMILGLASIYLAVTGVAAAHRISLVQAVVTWLLAGLFVLAILGVIFVTSALLIGLRGG